jgi:hypothetical protein
MGEAYFIVSESQLRKKILELSPEIRRDTEREADMIRELVKLEREKLGLDNPRGTLELRPNKEKGNPGEPDLIGSGRIAGRFYRAMGWISKTDKIRIALLPPKRK